MMITILFIIHKQLCKVSRYKHKLKTTWRYIAESQRYIYQEFEECTLDTQSYMSCLSTTTTKSEGDTENSGLFTCQKTVVTVHCAENSDDCSLCRKERSVHWSENSGLFTGQKTVACSLVRKQACSLVRKQACSLVRKSDDCSLCRKQS